MSWFTVGAAALGLIGSRKANKANAAINDASIAFQREAAQNAHQWEVEDLRKAGLNPILSAGGSGAHVGTPSMIGSQNELDGAVNNAIATVQARDSHKIAKETLIGLAEDNRSKSANADAAETNRNNLNLMSNYLMPVLDNNGKPIVTLGEDGLPTFEMEPHNLIVENFANQVSNTALQNEHLKEEITALRSSNVRNLLEAAAYSSPYGSLLYGLDKGMQYLNGYSGAVFNLRSRAPRITNFNNHNEHGTVRYTGIYNAK